MQQLELVFGFSTTAILYYIAGKGSIPEFSFEFVPAFGYGVKESIIWDITLRSRLIKLEMNSS